MLSISLGPVAMPVAPLLRRPIALASAAGAIAWLAATGRARRARLNEAALESRLRRLRPQTQ